ncbi:MAG: putative sortase [Candidatus Saccharibacteria bacterium]|nr:putative sortase [Candidatus Saccharibacteria bacterium]
MADTYAPTPTFYPKPVHPKAAISFRHNILPPLLGVGMFVAILGALNSQWIMAQAQYRFTNSNSQSTFVSSTFAPPVDSVALGIPKINVNAPIVYDETSLNEGKVQLALRRGVVHYGNTALPGQAGNMVVLGHSSGQAWAPGDYKFVFTMLDKMEVGDRITLDYKGTRYIYRVSEKRVVPPTDLTVVKHTDDPRLTLITCTPVGTNKNRLVISAAQISPKPSTATPISPEDVPRITSQALPR